MSDFIAGAVFGWMIGSAFMWFYMINAGLFRTRDEYYAAKGAQR